MSDDNLIHLVMIVKNSAPTISEVLTRVLPYIDEWTILDTGSTDGTQGIIKECMKNKRGNLYEEPFVDFKVSRNRSLDLAGNSCIYNLILDDTYILEGGDFLRNTLREYRDNKDVKSFCIPIVSNFTSYDSCRIIRTDSGLRYIFKIHEVIGVKEPSLRISIENACLRDPDSDYMKNRTHNRMSLDLKLLKEEKKEDPENPRHLFYIGQTYVTMKQYERAIKWYRKRINSPYVGFDEEIYNAKFRIGIISEINLGKDWNECHQLYLDAYNYYPHRAEPLLLIADHYYREKNYEMAYIYTRRAYEKPFPHQNGLFVEKNYYDFETPNMLTNLCYYVGDYALGQEATEKALQHKVTDSLIEWLHIYTSKNNIRKLKARQPEYKILNKPVLCIVTEGNFFPWNRYTIDTKGLGGSETSAALFAEQFAKMGYSVFVFCKCIEGEENTESKIDGVQYYDISKYVEFLATYKIDICVVLRYAKWLSVSYEPNVGKIYLWLQDILPHCSSLILGSQLKKVLCLTSWHKEVFHSQYSFVPKDMIAVTSNAVQLEKFVHVDKKPFSFIYSSFPDRGLYYLLKMFPRIKQSFPEARLNVFCNLSLTKKSNPELIAGIESMLEEQREYVTNHGWVSQNKLREYFLQSEVWLYPCVFAETSCITSIECAAAKTLAITNDLGALSENVGDRGIVVPGDPRMDGWQEIAIHQVKLLLSDEARKKELIDMNYEFSKRRTYEVMAKEWQDKYFSL
jgi:tetratricopeptide (TPR) repeat protein